MSLCGSPVYMVKRRVFIFGSVWHLYWGYPQRKNYTSVNNILKVKIFKENSCFALFSSVGIHAKDTKFINCTHTTHTKKYTYT